MTLTRCDAGGWEVVGRDGDRFLLRNGDQGKVHDLEVEGGNETLPQWLQVWFKWGNWEDTTTEEYVAAIEARNAAGD